MALLLNQGSHLRLRLELVRRLSDGVETPASLEVAVALERYRHARPGAGTENAFEPLLGPIQLVLLDLDLIAFLHELEALLEQLSRDPQPAGEPLQAQLQPSQGSAFGLRLAEGQGAALVELGLDLAPLLEPVAGAVPEPGHDLALLRFSSTRRGLLAFSAGLLEEFGRFPTDPARVAKGAAV